MMADGEKRRRNRPKGPWLYNRVNTKRPTATVGTASRVLRISSAIRRNLVRVDASQIPEGIPIRAASSVLLREKRSDAHTAAVTSGSAETIIPRASCSALPSSLNGLFPYAAVRSEQFVPADAVFPYELLPLV